MFTIKTVDNNGKIEYLFKGTQYDMEIKACLLRYEFSDIYIKIEVIKMQ